MGKARMLPGWERQVKTRIRPAMKKLGDEMLAEWLPTIHVDSGEMKGEAYVEVNSDAEITIGTKSDHGIYEELGTSERPAHPTLGPVVRKNRGKRRA
jgi:hypothetical protein